MRKILYITLATFCLIACDNIAEEDRLIYEPLPEVNRSVLIEDFTGQRCVNCPNAADEIHNLQEEYGEDVIVAVGIHGGPMAVYPNPERGIVGLATEIGEKYNEYWKVEQWPMGMVNRGGVCSYTDWKAKVHEELQKKAPVDISLSNEMPDADGHIRVAASVQGVRGVTTGKLQIWMVEDNVTAIQLMPDGTANQSYVHQHVFRAAVNGEWGEDITVEEGESIVVSETITIPADWKRENLSLVAFVYNDQGVQQVTRSSLKNE
ncbi:MAG: Omp28 family outer membrane lipoprotein [Bacteroidaceae bacterium]|nr:Omp28 family outer membrane lipoprotein [Bacteroidaceae bacterium]